MASRPDLKSIAALVREERTKKGWSQERLGQEAGVATNTVFSVEQGTPTFKKSRDKVAGALGVELE
jgi:transcriptional regulator with XRE-family HTH domain